MFGHNLQDHIKNVVSERNFRQSNETPRLLAGGVRNKHQITDGKVDSESAIKNPEQRKVYIYNIVPDEIVRKSARKLKPG